MGHGGRWGDRGAGGILVIGLSIQQVGAATHSNRLLEKGAGSLGDQLRGSHLSALKETPELGLLSLLLL